MRYTTPQTLMTRTFLKTAHAESTLYENMISQLAHRVETHLHVRILLVSDRLPRLLLADGKQIQQLVRDRHGTVMTDGMPTPAQVFKGPEQHLHTQTVQCIERGARQKTVTKDT